MTSTMSYAQQVKAALSPRYAELTLHGESASGIDFAARAGGETGPYVAIKVAYPGNGVTGVSGVADTAARFHRECEIGAQLSHPRIARVSPAEVVDGVEFFEMQAAGAIRLEHLVLASEPPSYERIVSIMQEIADALDYAHARGIVHGNLRPSVVELDAHGHVLVRHFLLYDGKEATHPALAPAVIGDAAYMPPEQWHDAQVDRRVDVYAAGMLAYELCTGHARVVLETAGRAEVQPIELVPNRSLRGGVPPHAIAAIRLATSKEAAMRFASVGAFVEALRSPEHARGHSLPTIAPPLAPQRTRPWLLVLLVLAVALGTATIIPSDARAKAFGWVSSYVNPTSTTRRRFNPRESRSEPRGGTQGDASRDAAWVSRATRRNDLPASGQAVRTGVLLVRVDRGSAVVLVNGVPRGATPLTLSLPPGSYRVSLRGVPGYDPRERRVAVARADTAVAEFHVTKARPDELHPTAPGDSTRADRRK